MLGVLRVRSLAAREGVVGATAGALDFPRQKASGDAQDRVQVPRLQLRFPAGEGEHRTVHGANVVGKAKTLHDVLARSR